MDINILYIFHLSATNKKTFKIQLNPDTLDIIQDNVEEIPYWADLDFHKCPHCKLSSKINSRCLIALNFVEVISWCSNLLSYSDIKLEVITPERAIYKTTTVQRGLSSLLGVIMATSGCPKTAYFKPMARFHLPFSSEADTIYRAASMYMLAQYFAAKQGMKPDIEMQGLQEIYKGVQIVNRSIGERLRGILEKDAVINAITELDLFAKTMPLVGEESFEEIKHMFYMYLR